MNLSDIRKYIFVLLLIFLAFPFAGIQTFGQVTEIMTGYAAYNQTNLQEKMYLHTDRSFYVCGEVLWFKAYLVNATTNRPLSLSKVAYVEILNQQHQPVLQGKIAMLKGLGSGSFILPFSLQSGNYELRAYTNWMKNYPPDLYFKKDIMIINTTKNLDSSAIHEQVSYQAGFFPEGGNLVNGLESEIAFKVSDNKNKGIDCYGVIVDQFNNTIAHIKTLHAGMGHFYLRPETGKDYTAIITCADGSVIRKNIPAAYNAGYVMHLTDTSIEHIKISITTTGLRESNPGAVYIIVQNNGHINLATSQLLENGTAVLVINKDSLKDGMTQVTVFDANKHPQCERLYFKRPKNKMLINIKGDKRNYQLRSKVLIDVATSGSPGNSLAGNLSVAVFRLDSLHQPGRENIFSYLWLSSNLRGTIEDPGYYFNNENAGTNEALNNLVLAQGWRKFNWEKALQKQTPSFTYVPEYSGHIISGKITNESTKKPVPDILVYLSVPGRRVQLKGCVSDSNGLVHFDMKDFVGSDQIVVQLVGQTNTGADNMYRLAIFTPFSGEFSEDVLPAFYVSESDKDYLQAGNFHMQVEKGYHEKDLQKLQTPLIDTLPFYTKPSKTYLLDNYTRFTTMEEVMREYVEEVSVRRKGDNFRFMTLNEPAFPMQDKQPTELMFKENPLVLLDGVPVFDINKIVAYDPLKVEKLEVVASRYYWGPIVADGIASFTTYKGKLEGYTLDPNDLVLDYPGLQQQRIFYSPDYSSDKEQQSRLPDFRDVLYWSPDIATTEEGNGSFSFYTGDIPGTYYVDLQGISRNGDAGSAGMILNVEK
ncbi:MAG: hypothetical protein ABI472_14870 [Ginsengibacter sp.]